MMWTVTCEIVKGKLEYYVENTATGERIGTYDCEPWAQRDAEERNKRDEKIA